MKFGKSKKIWTTPAVIAACAVAFAVGTGIEFVQAGPEGVQQAQFRPKPRGGRVIKPCITGFSVSGSTAKKNTYACLSFSPRCKLGTHQVGTGSEKFDGSRFVYTCQPKGGAPK